MTDIEPCVRPHNVSDMTHALIERYRCPEEFLDFELAGPLSADSGYFRFGKGEICYGRSAAGYRTPNVNASLYESLCDLETRGSTLRLPFNPSEVIDNLRLERYAQRAKPSEWIWRRRFLRDSYYFLRPYLGAGIRGYLKQIYADGWRRIPFPHWPVDTTVEQLSEALLLASMKAKGVDRMPFIWFWPQGATGSVIMTHDVEASPGYDFCRDLMDIDDAYGIKASFQLVPEERYQVEDDLLREIRERGFEINVQDLNHDGYLFADREKFLHRVAKINRYGKTYGAKGFRAAVLYHDIDWYDALDFSYDMSVPNVAHLDPQKGGSCTVMPYFVGDMLEIPVTTTQDYMLFYQLHQYSLDLWKTQADLILRKHGLVSFLVHPDYVIEEQPRKTYGELLGWLRELAARKRLWLALPGEVDAWWRARSGMHLVNRAGMWRIEGAGADRAVVAFAKTAGDHIEYDLDGDGRSSQPGRPK